MAIEYEDITDKTNPGPEDPEAQPTYLYRLTLRYELSDFQSIIYCDYNLLEARRLYHAQKRLEDTTILFECLRRDNLGPDEAGNDWQPMK